MMVMFEEQLEWRQHPEAFTSEQRKVLLALSNKKWLWRTLDSLQKATSLPQSQLNASLKTLMERGVVRGSISRGKREPIFGLVERVGPGRNRAKLKG